MKQLIITDTDGNAILYKSYDEVVIKTLDQRFFYIRLYKDGEEVRILHIQKSHVKILEVGEVYDVTDEAPKKVRKGVMC